MNARPDPVIRYVPVLNSYRNVLAGIFQGMYGLNQVDLQFVFPKASAVDIGLV